MTQREVTLDGGAPWGFRMQGGVDLRTPLKVSRVNPGSKAAQRGIREGDIITSINDLSTKILTNNEAHALLSNADSTLKLGLNKDIALSPKKRQYRTIHQETHKETVKRSSLSYTLKETIERSSSRNSKDNEFETIKVSRTNQGTKHNGNDVRIVTNIPVSLNSTSSSSSTSTPSTLVVEGKTISSDHAIASRQSSYSNCSSIPDEGLDAVKAMNNDGEDKMSKSKKRRQRRKNLLNRTLSHDSQVQSEAETDAETENDNREIILQPSLDKLDILKLKRIEHKYKVESPKELKLDKKLKTKSKSLDDDDLLNIQELSEASENEDVIRGHTNIVISEASSEENLLDDFIPKKSSTNLELELNDNCQLESTSLISPAEEHALRTFLGGLNLVNSPEESAKDLYERTSGVTDSKAKKIQKRKELEEYFVPIAQNPRYLDAISEEASDISDKESSHSTASVRHLKQGTPELNKVELLKVTSSVLEEPILVESIKENFVKANEAELVYLSTSSNSTTSELDDEPSQKSYDFQIDSQEAISTVISSHTEVSNSILTPPLTPNNSTSNVVFDYTRIPNVLKAKEPADGKALKEFEQKNVTAKNCVDGNEVIKNDIQNNFEVVEENHEKCPGIQVQPKNKKDKPDNIVSTNKSKAENTNKIVTASSSLTKSTETITSESKKESTLKQMIMTSNNKTDSQKLLEFQSIKMLNDEVKDKINRQELVGPLFRKSKSPSVSKDAAVVMNCHEEGTSFVRKRVKEFSNVVQDNRIDNEEPNKELINSRIKTFSNNEARSEGSILKRIILREDTNNNIKNVEEKNIPIKLEREQSILEDTVRENREKEKIITIIIDKENVETANKSSETNHKEIVIPIEMEASKKIIDYSLVNTTNNDSKESVKIETENITTIENSSKRTENVISNKDIEHINKTIIVEHEEIDKEKIIPDKIFSNNLKHINESLQNIIDKQPKEENGKNNKKERIISVDIIDDSNKELKEFGIEHINKNNYNEIIPGNQNVEEKVNPKKLEKILTDTVKMTNETIIPIRIAEEKIIPEFSNNLKHINESLQSIIEKQPKEETEISSKERIIPVEIIEDSNQEELKLSKDLEHINKSLQNIIKKQPKEENEKNNKERIIPVEIIDDSNKEHINKSLQNIIEKQPKQENEKIHKQRIISFEIIGESNKEEIKLSKDKEHINKSLQNIIEKQPEEENEKIHKQKIIPTETINKDLEKFKKLNDLEHINKSLKNMITKNEPPVPPPRKSKAFLLRKTQKHTEIPVSKDITYTNVLSPPRPASASSDSTSCSEESSRCTAKYNPNSSIADVASISEFCELKQPESLSNIVLKLLISLPFGEEMLKVLADASSKTIENLIIHTNLFKDEMPTNGRWYTNADCEQSKIVELHQKFLTKRLHNDDQLRETITSPNRFLTIIQEEDSAASSSSAKNLSEWLTLARDKSKSTSNLDCTNVPINNLRRFDVANYPQNELSVQRRRSLPQEIYEKQLVDIMEKEREIQRELEKLEEEKRKLRAEIAPSKQFQVDEFYVSKNGDFAERKPDGSNKKDRPVSMPVFPTEFFRQQMFEEYMDKFSEREERKQQKVIKISSSNDLDQSHGTKSKEIIHPVEIEQEFMDKVKQKFQRREENDTVATPNDSSTVDETPVLVLDGDKVKGVQTLPRHLQEFVGDLTTLQQDEDDSIWSPGQPRRPPSPPKQYQRTQSQTFQQQNDPQSPIWAPKSANSSPTVERKEFRPVNFQSPVLTRKTRTRSESIQTPDSTASEPPWRLPEGISDNAINLSSTLDRRLPTSQSSPGFGYSSISPRLPRAQNPTITLLQKAREGQLPRGAQYIIDQDRRPPNDRPPIKYPGEVLYNIRNEYTSESDSEKPRKMVDLSPRKFEGIGPTSKDGMPLILRSEVKDKDQSKWYKRMYDTIHKQKPHRDEYVTIRYKQKRAQYPYSSGYLSEPEPGAYDSDFTEYKYQTLDRRRTPQTVHYNSSTMPRNVPENRSYSSSDVVKNTHGKYANQPGRIENYRPGHSSISEKEAKQWWDEVMDIFDGHLEQQSRVPPQKPRSFINQALKESGYESDSTLVFKRKEETAASQISPKEQREAYKTIQKGGDVPFQGLRKLAPERPKETDLVEFFPISPTLTKIRIHKSIIPSSKENVLLPRQDFFCYPATVHHSTKTFANFKRTAPSSVDDSNIPPPPPSPPKRKSSRNNTTLRLISTMKVKTEKSPVCKRHETCFTSGPNVDRTKVNYLKDKITCKLSPKRKVDSPKLSVVKKITTSPELKSKITSTLTTSKDPKSSTRKISSSTRISTSRGLYKSGSTGSLTSKKSSTESLSAPTMKTFGTEKKKFDLTLPILKTKLSKTSSEELLSPTEVKKGMKNIKSSIIKKSSPKANKKPTESLSTKKTVSANSKPKLNKQKSKKDSINDSLKQQINHSEISQQKEAIQSNHFFRNLFLRNITQTASFPAPKNSWLLEKTNQLSRRRASITEPSVGAMKIYLKHIRPVSDSKFISLDSIRSRSASPKSVTFSDNVKTEANKVGTKRSKSLPSKMVFSQTSRPVSPVVTRSPILKLRNLITIRTPSPPNKLVFTETSRPISPVVTKKQVASSKNFRETSRPVSPVVVKRSSSPQKLTKLFFSETTRPISPDVRRKFTPPASPMPRSPSCRKIMQLKLHKPQELTLYTCPDLKHSNTSLDSFKSEDLFIFGEPSEKFKDLNHFYNDIEKVGELERKFSSKPRKRCENEIIDYDRWMEVRARERAEHELKHLYTHLKHHEKEKGFLYLPKDVQGFRWKKELDRGLRIKEKSVENIKEEFERLKKEESDRENAKRREMAYSKDTYKPLWRGNSVVNLANILTERRSQSEGRVKTARQKLLDSENLLTHGIGSRIWSSLSMEQVNNLKKQLQEIYGEDHLTISDKEPIKKFTVEVPRKHQYNNKTPHQLTVRRNSESSKHDLMISEDEKKLISQTISKEVLEKINKKRREDKLALPLVIGKEMLGAMATREAQIIQPQKPLVKTNALDLPNSISETDSTDESTRTVVNLTDEVQKKVEYFEKAKEIENYVPTVYKAAEDGSSGSHSPTELIIPQSKSCQNFKEYFGETELVKFATLPLSATRKSDHSYTKKPHLRALDISPIRTISEANSFDSLIRSRSVSPYYEEAQALTKKGEVKKLKRQFEFFEDFFGEKKLKRSRSENDLDFGHNVEDLRRKYEYPVHSGRGRSRVRRGGMVSPVWLRAEDRYMPHINIISKIASLYSFSKNRTDKEASKSMEELAEILGCPVGEVEKMKEKFDKIREQEQVSLVGHMYTSSPNIRELRDITPYLTANWIAHKFPRSEDNTRSLSSPDASTASRDTALVRRDRPRPFSPSKKGQSILKATARAETPPRYTKEPDLPPPPPPPKSQGGVRSQEPESPRKYVENEVTIHYKTPVRTEIKEYVSEDELAHRQAEAMKKIYEEEKKRKYLQVSKSMQELHDMKSRRHTDNFIPSQKSPIPLNRYDDFDDLTPTKTRPRSPEPRLVAKALYNFVGQTARELTFRKGDLIYVRRQVDKNWYEGELNAMVGLFPVNYVEIVPYEGIKSAVPRKAHEGQARAKFNFVAQTHLELSLAKGELVTITRKVDDNWFEGKIGGRKGIFPVAYVDVLIDPSDPAPPSVKPVASPAAHSLLLNGSAQGRESMGSHLYTPNVATPVSSIRDNGYHHAKPVQLSGSGTYSTLPKSPKSSVEALHIETQSEPIPYRALYKYAPQNDDELELLEGDMVYVLEKCDDGWYVGSSDRTGAFGTFPGNYVEKI